jgi:hypothetical protein
LKSNDAIKPIKKTEREKESLDDLQAALEEVLVELFERMRSSEGAQALIYPVRNRNY